MVRRQLGRSALAVSPVGLGTTKFGRNTDVKYPAHFSLPSLDEIGALLELCHSLGVNLIDTAPAYGESEQRLGWFMESHRNRLVVCTKCGERYEGGRSTYDFSASAIESSVENSLRRLRTDYIDMLLLHSNGDDLRILTETDALEALSRLKASGKIRLAGISAKTESGVREAARSLDVVMAPFSQKESQLGAALAAAHEKGLGVLGIKALFSGHLEPAGAIEYVLKQEFIDSLILGTINPEHLKAAVGTAEKVRGN